MDLYILLGVEREASLDDIKRAYRRLARRFHPDINPGDRASAQQFRLISDAYETLSDPDRRRRYDTSGPEPAVSGPPATFGFEGFDFTIRADGSAASTFGDLFAEVFRPRAAAASQARPRGADIHLSLALPFEAAMRGGSHAVTITRQEHCRDCGGVGRVPVAESRCPLCRGRAC